MEWEDHGIVLSERRHGEGGASPRPGGAVRARGAEPCGGRWRARPAFLVEPAAVPSAADLKLGLALTGHFLIAHLFAPHSRREPPARIRLLERIGRGASLSPRGESA